MSSTITDNEIKDFVRKVRGSLKGLSAQDQAELTETLEGDLIDRRASEGIEFKLGSPEVFAKELAEGAGLEASKFEAKGLGLVFLKLLSKIGGYLSTLDPAWAIFRGYLFYSVIFSYFVFGGIQEIPYTSLSTVIMFAFIALSMWLSIKKFKAMKYPVIALNIIGLVASLFMGVSLQNKVADYQYYTQTRGLENTMIDSQGNLHQTVCAYDDLGNQLNARYITDGMGFTLMEMPQYYSGFECPPHKNVK
jgi:hypothetical protein